MTLPGVVWREGWSGGYKFAMVDVNGSTVDEFELKRGLKSSHSVVVRYGKCFKSCGGDG